MKHGTGQRKTKRKQTQMISVRERRMLVQLTVSLLLFAVAMFGRNVFPERMEYWKGLLRQDINFERAFSDFGEAAL